LARKILLADDSVTAQNMGRKILADAGYDVITVNNGSAALKRITEVKPDLIVLDVYMPGYSGLEVCQRIKDADETEHIPVLLTVGKLEPFKPEEARRVRADGHIVKPFEASELLTAITRLEDRMVPQQSDSGRFSTSVSGVERFGGSDTRKTENSGDADTGWKSRLRFPSKKKKEEPEPEPEPEDATAAAPFREFRKTKGKSSASAPFAVKAPPPPGQEPGLVPDIPRDITPDELDALSALAAKLDGPIPAAENIVPLAEAAPAAQTPSDQTKSNIAAVEAVSTEIAAASEVPKTYAEIVAEAQKKKEDKAEAEAPVAAVESAAPPVAATASGVGVTSEVEIPAKQVEATPDPAPVVAEAAPIPQPQIQHSETQPAEVSVAAVTVNTASLAQEPAPVDRNDEPMFTAVASAPEQPKPASDKAEEKVEQKVSEATAQDKADPNVAAATAIAKSDKRPAEQPQEQEQELRREELSNASAQTEKSLGEASKPDPAQPSPVPASVMPQDSSPSDAELAQALRLLTPAGGNSDSAIIPSHGTLAAAGQLLAEEALRNAASGPRWIARPVALSPEEASISLETEMFRAFMIVPPAAFTSLEPSRMTGVSAITAAVENRLAAAELAGAKVISEQAPEQGSSAHPQEAKVPAEVAESHSAAASAHPETSELPSIKTDTIAATDTPAEKPNAESKNSAAKITDATPAPFAVAAGQSEAPAEPGGLPAGITMAAATAAVAEQNQDSSSEVGSEESMAKDSKSKSGNSNWHQIRTAPAGAAADSNLVEAAKQAQSAPEESKAMAATAAEGASPSAPDASAIASIVDSVMADLRPKIVEEIAKKLARK
jgi:CheY-like chemotaxis protein